MNQDLRVKTNLPLTPSFLLPSSLTIRNTNWGEKCYRVRVETRIGRKLLRRTCLELDCLRKLVFGISIGTQSTKSNSFLESYHEEEKPRYVIKNMIKSYVTFVCLYKYSKYVTFVFFFPSEIHDKKTCGFLFSHT